MRPYLGLFLAFTALLAPAQAQPPPDAKRTLAADKRLSAPVTVRWQKTALSDALQDIAKATGAQMTAEPGLVDEPVMAAITNLPGHKLMEELATLLHYTWVKVGGTPEAPVYRLVQTRAQKQEEQDEIDKAAREVLQALEKELARYRKLSQMSPEQLEKEQEKSDQALGTLLAGGFQNMAGDLQAGRSFMDGMAVRAVGSPIGRAMLTLLEGLSPAQKDELRKDEVLVFSSKPAPGEDSLPGGLLDQMREGKPAFPFPKAMFRQFAPQAEEGINQAEKMMQERWSQAEGFKVSVQLSLNLGAQPMGLLRVAPEPTGGGKAENPGEQMFGALFGMSGIMIMASPEMLREPEEDPAERDKRLCADPVLGKKAVLKLPPAPMRSGLLAAFSGGHRASEVLPLVEEAFGVKILSDAYTRQGLTPFKSPGDGEVPLYKVLDALASGTRRWELIDGIVRMKSRTWAHDRRAEIPIRLIKQWNATREKQGGFTLDNLAEIALTLRDPQLESLMFVGMEGEGARDMMNFMAVASNRGILRAYGKLMPAQKSRLRAGQALTLRGLLPAQQALFIGMNKSQNQSMMSFATGVKPRRSNESLAGAVLSLKRDGTRGSEGATPAELQALGGVGLPSAIYTFKLAFAQGDADQYTLMVVEPIAKGAAPRGGRPTTPASPRKPPAPQPIPEQSN